MAALLAVWAGMAPCQSVSLEMDALEGAGWNTGALRLTLVAGAAARLEARSVEAFGRRFDKVVLTCSRFSSERGIWRCEDGTIEAGTPAAGTPGAPQKIGVTASFDPARHELALELLPEPGERWVFTQRAGDNLLKLDNAALARLAGWLPGATKPSAGRVQGEVRWNAASVSTDLRFKGLGFADNTGLRAGENLAGGLTLTANLADGKWRWRTRLGWDSGALLIDPLYIAEGGHALDAEGELVGQALGVTRAALDFKGLGRLEMTGAADLAADALGDWTIKADDLALAGVRAILPQAWLEQHGLADLTLAGRGALALAGDAAGLARARVTLSGASAGAATRRLVLGGVDLAFDYAPGATRPFLLALQHLQVGGLKFGPVKAAGEVRDGRLYLPTLAAPVQDGALTLRDIEVGRSNGFWNARLAGGFGPLSMEKLSAALEWHPMRGAVSGVLPQMHYEESVSGSIFSVDGALGFKVFGGDASVDAIRIANLFGRTPHLSANVRLTGMDLETLTGAVKFGNITGRADLTVLGLEMENWQPLSFDARFATSPGDFPKRISQRAVQNISSLGGAGAGAAIQASFLRMFDSFGYSRIGLSCRLRGGVCEMAGLDNKGGGFTLIEGGGIPSVNVVGYNRYVDWQELLDRIQAVIEGNSKMIVQ